MTVVTIYKSLHQKKIIVPFFTTRHFQIILWPVRHRTALSRLKCPFLFSIQAKSNSLKKRSWHRLAKHLPTRTKHDSPNHERTLDKPPTEWLSAFFSSFFFSYVLYFFLSNMNELNSALRFVHNAIHKSYSTIWRVQRMLSCVEMMS